MVKKKRCGVKPKKQSGKGFKKGEKLVCGVCGMEVVIDSVCGCPEVHPIICCGKPMKKKRSSGKK